MPVAILAALFVVPAGPAAAADPPQLATLAANSTDVTGAIDVLVIAPGDSVVDVFEVVNGVRTKIRTLSMGPGIQVPDGRKLAYSQNPRIATALCDRRTRDFVVTTSFNFQPISATSSVRTHSCRKRFKLAVPEALTKGRTLTAKVTDTFKLGDENPKVCFTPPGKAKSCKTVAINGSRGSRSIRINKAGNWKVELRGPDQVVKRTVAVGTLPAALPIDPNVVLYGDSIMSQLSVPIEDGLPIFAQVENNVKGGSGLADTEKDWVGLAGRRTAALKPKVSVVLLGGGDGNPIRDPLNGAVVGCCTQPWVDAYSHIAQSMLENLTSTGGKAIWVLNATPDATAGRPAVVAAVAAAARQAVPAVKRAHLVDLASIFPAGSNYHAGDGLHFTIGAADTAAQSILSAIGSVRRTAAPKPCAKLKGSKLAKCKLDRNIIKSCGKLDGRKKSDCTRRLRALAKCDKVKNKAKKGACRTKARAIGKNSRR